MLPRNCGYFIQNPFGCVSSEFGDVRTSGSLTLWTPERFVQVSAKVWWNSKEPILYFSSIQDTQCPGR